MGPTSNACTGDDMDGEAILAALDVGPNALATVVPSPWQTFEAFPVYATREGCTYCYRSFMSHMLIKSLYIIIAGV